MTFVQWGPSRGFPGLDRELGAVLNAAARSLDSGNSSAEWRPRIETFERGTDLVIRAELPGVSREEIEIKIENDRLILTGERKSDFEVEEGRRYRSERHYGPFSRSFRLPETVDRARVSATHKDGVLEIVLPEAESAKPKRIEIVAA